MGTKRRVCVWEQRGSREFAVEPPGWRPKDGDIIFTKRSQMLDFARAAGLILKERVRDGRIYG